MVYGAPVALDALSWGALLGAPSENAYPDDEEEGGGDNEGARAEPEQIEGADGGGGRQWA